MPTEKDKGDFLPKAMHISTNATSSSCLWWASSSKSSDRAGSIGEITGRPTAGIGGLNRTFLYVLHSWKLARKVRLCVMQAEAQVQTDLLTLPEAQQIAAKRLVARRQEMSGKGL